MNALRGAYARTTRSWRAHCARWRDRPRPLSIGKGQSPNPKSRDCRDSFPFALAGYPHCLPSLIIPMIMIIGMIFGDNLSVLYTRSLGGEERSVKRHYIGPRIGVRMNQKFICENRTPLQN